MSLTLSIPFQDPASAFAPFADQAWAMLLDSAPNSDERGRYAYLAIGPYRTLTATGKSAKIDGRPVDGDPLALLKQLLAADSPRIEDQPVPFAGGAMGLFGYGLSGTLENLPRRHDHLQPDLAVGLYNLVVAFDRSLQRGWIIASGPDAAARAQSVAAQIAKCKQLKLPPSPRLALHAEMGRDDYLARVAKTIAYIYAGDIFQANFTQRFLAKRPSGLREFDLYLRLRAINPAPFAAFLRCGQDFCIASASPERFLRLDLAGNIEARPIKGTRRRSDDPREDRELAAQLAGSVKDRAENLMITDLLRNDIARVARLGSIRVTALNQVESYATLHHLVSVVEGRLRPGLGPVDLLRASFPGGSVTGAPKIRAMEIIDELEAAPRGAYCGVAGWIGYDGAMDSSILIRTIVMDTDRIIAQAGGAITADSDPAAEYAEMMAKVAPALAALGGDVAGQYR